MGKAIILSIKFFNKILRLNKKKEKENKTFCVKANNAGLGSVFPGNVHSPLGFFGGKGQMTTGTLNFKKEKEVG